MVTGAKRMMRPGVHCTSLGRSTLQTVPIMGRPSAGICTAPSAMPSEMMSLPFIVSISGPSRRNPMRSHRLVVV